MSGKARQLVEHLQQFTATERVEHSELDKKGNPQATRSARFEYVVEIHDLVDVRTVSVEEYRNGFTGVSGFPTHLASKGLSAFALMFHPNYIGDFSIACEGVGEMQQRRVWQVRFAQQRSNTFRGYRVNNIWHPVKLQGTAWIAVDTGDVLRLDSRLLEPLPEIQLSQEHVIIDYRAVDFADHNVRLWLPQIAEVTINFRGHNYRQRHAFSDFQLFWVDVGEKRGEPHLDPQAELKD